VGGEYVFLAVVWVGDIAAAAWTPTRLLEEEDGSMNYLFIVVIVSMVYQAALTAGRTAAQQKQVV
jgi:hypothetical protein